MNFLDDLITTLTSNATVNAWANGGIKYNHLPTNFEMNKNWIVFWFSGNNVNTLGIKDLYEEYELTIQLVSEDIDSLVSIFDTLNTYLLDYKSDELEFILSEDSDPDFNLEKAVYYKNIKYTVLY